MNTARAILLLAACAVLAGCLRAGAHSIGSARDDRWIGKPRHTLAELRFENVVRQDLDYSCGAAALATLLTHYFHDPTTEEELLGLLDRQLMVAERAERQLTGYSLLDLKRVATTLGYDAAGYRLTLEQLDELVAPVIVHVAPMGYEHFAVLRDIVGRRVLLADPARGNVRLSIDRFEAEWSGVAFALGKPDANKLDRHRLSVSELRDVLPDRLRLHRQMDRDERLVPVPYRMIPALHR